jgi:hypothetical protein
MEKVTAFRCSFCGKILLTEKGCVAHEERFCGKSPHNLAACYSCKWYKQTEQFTTITRVGNNPLTGHEFEYEKEIQINICLKYNNAKMFNSFHASEELIDDAENNGFRIMPTMEEGCLDYKKKDEDTNI